MLRKKLNAILSSCLRLVISVSLSTSLASLGVECLRPPLEIRCGYLGGKFLPKNTSSPNFTLHKTFEDLNTT